MDFPSYLKYIEKIKDELPLDIYKFAKDETRHILNNPHSLHDAWLTSVTIKENRNIDRPFNAKTSIVIELLGPMHDRDIILSYAEVESYEINGKKNQFNNNDTFHGDIYRHEISLSEKKYEHKIWFYSNSIIKIEFGKFGIKEVIHK